MHVHINWRTHLISQALLREVGSPAHLLCWWLIQHLQYTQGMYTFSKLFQCSLFLRGSYASFLHALEMLESNQEPCYYKFSYYRVHAMQPDHEYYSVYLMIAYFGINFVYKQCISQVSATLLA